MMQEIKNKNYSSAVSTIQLDNARVTVTKWMFGIGTETGFHKHSFDYLVIPLTDGWLSIKSVLGIKRREMTAGEPYTGVIGTEHNVINDSNSLISFIEIEFKEGLECSETSESIHVGLQENDGEYK